MPLDVFGHLMGNFREEDDGVGGVVTGAGRRIVVNENKQLGDALDSATNTSNVCGVGRRLLILLEVPHGAHWPPPIDFAAWACSR